MSVNDLPLAERGRLLSELAATLATLPTERAQTWRLGEAMRLMLGADGVAITLEYLSDNRVTLCASDEVATALESVQEVLGQGPGFAAAMDDVLVVADLDGDADQRWPMLAQALESRYGPLRVYAVPVHAHGGMRGVATLHIGRQRWLSEPDDRVTFLVNAVGAALVADAAEHPEGHLQSGEGWSSRSLVHQATGMVMAQVRVTPEDALALLRGHAYALATDVDDVARRVVGRSVNFSNFDVEGD
ncbi:putative ANTAR domain protein [metagenome]|uniref:Putative ANTAR domain protein n=1 Tax=metagenome TaxID=256318 RepID=A0A2P2CA12_9ZZZZ